MPLAMRKKADADAAAEHTPVLTAAAVHQPLDGSAPLGSAPAPAVSETEGDGLASASRVKVEKEDG